MYQFSNHIFFFFSWVNALAFFSPKTFPELWVGTLACYRETWTGLHVVLYAAKRPRLTLNARHTANRAYSMVFPPEKPAFKFHNHLSNMSPVFWNTQGSFYFMQICINIYIHPPYTHTYVTWNLWNQTEINKATF